MAAVFASFFTFALVRSPVPGVNEPHYLARARHAWDPDWCRGDFFLESAEAHVVFYRTVGLLTRWWTLEETAWIGRVLALALLASGWTALVRRILPGRWSPWWAACAFLLLAAIGNFSGEWIVGGVEGKVFAYGLLFWAAALVPRRPNLAAVCAGLAVSFHPVVGVWGLAAAAFAGAIWLCAGRHGRGAGRRSLEATAAPGRLPRRFSGILPLFLLVACALPGLLPAVQMLGGTTSEVAAAANRIQVFDRLRHHLDPLEFSLGAGVGYGLLIAAWLIGRRRADRRRAERWFAWFVAGSVLVALAGLAIGVRPDGSQNQPLLNARAALLKFYPFRLADVMVPFAAAVTVVGLARRWTRSERWPRYHLGPAIRRGLLWPLFGAGLAVSLLVPAVDRNPSRLPADTRADWLDVCRWISRHAPDGAVFFTPRESWAFKWYGQRAEYVTRKDCPQDAAGIIEWRRRMDVRDAWIERLREALWMGVFQTRLEQLANETGVTHVIVYSGWRPPVPSVYRNHTYAILSVAELESAR